MVIIAVFDLEANAMDAIGAFLNANVNANMYCYIPQGFEEEGKVLKLKKALYGLRQSSKLWYDTLVSAPHGIGFSPNNGFGFTRITRFLFYFIFHVDNL
jgi:hypothetical protein